MSETNKDKGNIILKILIGVLVVVLYYIITAPWSEKLKVDALKLQSRVKMTKIRTGELAFIASNNRYSSSLQELVDWLKTDPFVSAKKDSIFDLKGSRLNLDSLIYSPVNGEVYKYQFSDSSAVKKYYLECPGGSGSIGSMTDDDKVNKSTWE